MVRVPRASKLPSYMTRRILIIDDEDDIRQVAAMSLETVAGWDVLLANSGRQGSSARAPISRTPSFWT